MDRSFDLIIVGAGAAGLTAALYASRRGLRTLVVSQDIGGQASTTAEIENYPGFDAVDGLALMMKFKAQAEKYGATVILDEVKAIVSDADGSFKVSTGREQYHSLTLVLAYGLTHRHLNVPGEERLAGKGVTYCATCDAPLYRGQNVAVVGGGNSAMDAALLLSRMCPVVEIITVNEEFHGENVLIERLNETKNINQYLVGTVKEIHGDDRVSGLVVDVSGQEKTLNVSGIFVEVGFTINPKLVKDLVNLDTRNQIIVHPTNNSTNIPGVFAAGDVTSVNQKQIVISAGEGAKAALGVHQYLQSVGKAKRAGVVDWGVKTPMHHIDPILPEST